MLGRIRNMLITRGYWDESGGDGGDAGAGDGGKDADAGDSGAGQEGKSGAGDEGGKGGVEDIPGLLGKAAEALRKKAEGDKGEGDKGKEGDKGVTAPTFTIEAANLEAIPEQFRKDGKLNAEALVKSWTDTRAELKNHQGKAPAKPEDYTLELPKVGDKELEIKNDEAMTAIRNAAHKHGLSQEQFQGVMGDFLNVVAAQLPEDIDPAAELTKMGENGKLLVDTVLTWGEKLKNDGVLGEDDLKEMLYTGATANGVRMLNKLRELAGEKSIPVGVDSIGEGLPSKAELYEMVASQKYQNEESYRAKVDKMFEQVFGDQPDQSSPSGLGVSPRAKTG